MNCTFAIFDQRKYKLLLLREDSSFAIQPAAPRVYFACHSSLCKFFNVVDLLTPFIESEHLPPSSSTMPLPPPESRLRVAPGSAGESPGRALISKKRKQPSPTERPSTLSSKSSKLHATLCDLVQQVPLPTSHRPPLSESKPSRSTLPASHLSVCRSFSSKTSRSTDVRRRQPSPPIATPPITVIIQFPQPAASPPKSPAPPAATRRRPPS